MFGAQSACKMYEGRLKSINMLLNGTHKFSPPSTMFALDITTQRFIFAVVLDNILMYSVYLCTPDKLCFVITMPFLLNKEQ